MDPMTMGMLAGAGIGVMEAQKRDEDAKRQRELAATMMETSPWTGMRPEQTYFERPSLMGTVGRGAVAGGMFGQQFGGGTAPQPGVSNYGQGPTMANAGYVAPQQQLSPWDLMYGVK